MIIKDTKGFFVRVGSECELKLDVGFNEGVGEVEVIRTTDRDNVSDVGIWTTSHLDGTFDVAGQELVIVKLLLPPEIPVIATVFFYQSERMQSSPYVVFPELCPSFLRLDPVRLFPFLGLVPAIGGHMILYFCFWFDFIHNILFLTLLYN